MITVRNAAIIQSCKKLVVAEYRRQAEERPDMQRGVEWLQCGSALLVE